MSLFDFCEHTRLGDLFDIKIGGAFSGRQNVDGTKGIPVVRGVDIARDQVRYEDLSKIEFRDGPIANDELAPRPGLVTRKSEIPEWMYLKAGDLLLPTITRSPRCFIVPDNWGPCVSSHSVLLLRKKHSTVDTEPIRQFLASEIGFDAISARASRLKGDVRISASSLRDVTVPIVSNEVTASILAADQLEQKIAAEADRLRLMKRRILSAGSLEELNTSLNVLKSQLLASKLGLHQSSDHFHRVRNYYPLPLAYPYRTLQAEHEKTRVLKQIFRTAEVQLAFLSSLTFAHGPEPERKIKDRIRQSWGGKGATFGSWLGVLSSVVSCLDESPSTIHKSLKQLIGNTERGTRFSEAVQWLNDQRDRFHHGDVAEGSELDDLVIEGLPWYPLFPFITCYHCPRCQVRETCYVDAFGKNSPAKLKSFERGHGESNQEVTDALSGWHKSRRDEVWQRARYNVDLETASARRRTISSDCWPSGSLSQNSSSAEIPDLSGGDPQGTRAFIATGIHRNNSNVMRTNYRGTEPSRDAQDLSRF